MAKYEILIAVRNEAEAHRKNKGDILAVRNHPWNWGDAEIKIGLVVIVESTKSFAEMEEYVDVIWEHKITKVQIPISALTESDIDEYQLKKKGAYNIDQVVLKQSLTDLDDTKMENMTLIYQPCKDATQLVQKFDGKNRSPLIKENDVNTMSVKAGKNTEFVIDLSLVAGLIRSNI